MTNEVCCIVISHRALAVHEMCARLRGVKMCARLRGDEMSCHSVCPKALKLALVIDADAETQRNFFRRLGLFAFIISKLIIRNA